MEATPPTRFRAHTFSLALPDGWADRSVYLFAGPAYDGLPHSITVAFDEAPAEAALDDYAASRAEAAAQALDDGRVLSQDTIRMDDGRPARRVLLRWQAGDEARYQEQLYVLAGGRGYVLSTAFTAASFAVLGNAVEAAMRTFVPTP
jgi:hypothetical protein